MANISNVRKLGILARVAAQRAERSRTFGAVLKGGRAVAAQWGRIARQLWLEVTGSVFLVLAATGAISFSREFVQFQAHKAGPNRMLVASIFTLTFAWFGLSSFWRVRKK